MWRILYLLLTLAQAFWCQTETTAAPVTAQDCSLDCIQKGDPACEYCRINRNHITKALGFNSIEAFGSCIPWPCFELLGDEDPKICQHYVQAPNDVKVEFINEPNPNSDTIVVSWKPSYYGIAFLRGFQVSLQALGGTSVACQLFLFHRNISLTASHAQRVYKSDPFSGLSLGSQYAVTVMALPVPEKWEKFYHSEIFSTQSCAEKNGFEQCKNDWYPKHIEVQQEGTAINVTFNLAPPNLGIRSYFSLCYANGMKKYTDIIPDLTTNKTHHSYQLDNLQEGANYTCEVTNKDELTAYLNIKFQGQIWISRLNLFTQIAANEVDAVRKIFKVQVTRIQKEGTSIRSAAPSLAVILPLCLVVVAILGACLAILSRRRPERQMKKFDVQLDIVNQHEEGGNQEEVVSLHRNRLNPPRLLICYSSHDGPTHVKAVMQLGVFIQQHMATQVCLDLWDSLSVAEEGSMAWHCRQIRECNFVLVICSRGFNQRPKPEDDDEDQEVNVRSNAYSSDAVIQLIGEEVGRAKAQGRDLSKYMAAIFEYSEETDIPTELRLISHYMLTSDLPLLFSHIHGVPLHRPGAYLKIDHISEKGFTKVPAGAALQWAIYEAGMAMGEKRLTKW